MTVEDLLRERFNDMADAASEDCGHLEDTALLLAGELPQNAVAHARAHATSCPTCSEAIRELDTPDRRRWKPWIGPAIGLAAAAALVFVLIPPDAPPESDTATSLTPKGEMGVEARGDRLIVAAQRGGLRWRVRADSRLMAGDRIGLFYSAAAAGVLSVLHVDTGGAVTPLYPPGGPGAPIQAGDELRLPDGAAMSVAEGCEWFVGVFSDAPLDPTMIVAVLRQAARGAEGCTLSATVPGARTVDVLAVQR